MPISVGLELAETAVRGAALERRGSSARVVGCAEVAWSASDPSTWVPALKQIRSSLGIRQPVVLGLPTTRAILATVEPLIVNPRRESLAIAFELQQQLPYDASQAVWHYQWLSNNGRGGAGQSGSAIVAATKASLLDERIAACRQAGIAVQAAGVGGLALANLWMRQAGVAAISQRPSVLLRIDGRVAEWIVSTSSSLHVVPVSLASGDAAREQIAATWAGIKELAAGAAPSGEPPLVYVIDDPDAGLSSAELERLLGCPTKPWSPSQAVDGGSMDSRQLGKSAAACGLALQGLGVAALPINFLVERQQRQREQTVGRTTWTVAFLGALVAAALAGHAMLAMLDQRGAVLDALTEDEHRYQSLRPDIRAQLSRQARIQERLSQLDTLGRGRSLIAESMQRLVEALPADMWLTKLELTKDDNALAGIFEGYARSFQTVTKWMDQLKASVGWSSVKPIATTVTTDPGSGKELIAFAVQSQQPLAKIADATPEEPSKDKTAKRPARSGDAPKPRHAAKSSSQEAPHDQE